MKSQPNHTLPMLCVSIAIALLVTALACILCSRWFWKNTIAQPITTEVASTGDSYTFSEAGIPQDYDGNQTNLAYIKAVYQYDGHDYITFDPINFTDCRRLRNSNETVPDACTTSTGEASAYAIEHTAATDVTLPLAENAGPYFTAYDGPEGMWKTMNATTLGQALTGTMPLSVQQEYYAPELHGETSLFHVTQANGVVTLVAQKYFE